MYLCKVREVPQINENMESRLKIYQFSPLQLGCICACVSLGSYCALHANIHYTNTSLCPFSSRRNAFMESLVNWKADLFWGWLPSKDRLLCTWTGTTTDVQDYRLDWGVRRQDRSPSDRTLTKERAGKGPPSEMIH